MMGRMMRQMRILMLRNWVCSHQHRLLLLVFCQCCQAAQDADLTSMLQSVVLVMKEVKRHIEMLVSLLLSQLHF